MNDLNILLFSVNAVAISINIFVFFRYLWARKRALEAIDDITEAEHKRILRRVGIINMANTENIHFFKPIDPDYH